MSNNSVENFEPKILVFACNWCTYAGADLAGTSRLQYPPNVRVLRVPCSCRVNPQFVIRAFQRGIDGVLVAGCHPGDCHYTTGNYYTRRRFLLITRMMEYMGIDPKRFHTDGFPVRRSKIPASSNRNDRRSKSNWSK